MLSNPPVPVCMNLSLGGCWLGGQCLPWQAFAMIAANFEVLAFNANMFNISFFGSQILPFTTRTYF